MRAVLYMEDAFKQEIINVIVWENTNYNMPTNMSFHGVSAMELNLTSEVEFFSGFPKEVNLVTTHGPTHIRAIRTDGNENRYPLSWFFKAPRTADYELKILSSTLPRYQTFSITVRGGIPKGWFTINYVDMVITDDQN